MVSREQIIREIIGESDWTTQVEQIINTLTSEIEYWRQREAKIRKLTQDLLDLWDNSMILTKAERDAFDRMKEALDDGK